MYSKYMYTVRTCMIDVMYCKFLHEFFLKEHHFILGSHKPGPTEADGVYQPVYIFEKNL